MNETNTTVDRDEPMPPKVKLLIVIFLLIVLGNLFMIVRIFKRKKRQQMTFLCFKFNKISRMSFYIIFLSLADINVALSSVLTFILMELNAYSGYRGPSIETLSNASCKLVVFGQIFSVYMSIYIMVLMAHDRYVCICKPFESINWNYKTGIKNVILIIVFAFGISCPQFAIYRLGISFFTLNFVS
jgi:hypothetical protein